MPKLLFNEFTLIKGNTYSTVRRGIKWSIAEPCEFGFPVIDNNHPINDDGMDIIQGFAEPVVAKVLRFKDLNDNDISDNHDPLCHVKTYLFEYLKGIYPEFDENEIITLLRFYYN